MTHPNFFYILGFEYISYIPSEMGGDPLFNIASPPRLEETERNIMYFIYDTKTKVNRGFADTKKEAELLLKELSHKWYYRYLVIR